MGNVLRFALEGKVVTDFLVRDRSIDVLLRLDRLDLGAPGDLESIVLFSKTEPRVPIRLGDLAEVAILPQPSTILRDRQQSMVEVTASLGDDMSLEEAIEQALAATVDLELPPGYSLYEAGSLQTLQDRDPTPPGLGSDSVHLGSRPAAPAADSHDHADHRGGHASISPGAGRRFGDAPAPGGHHRLRAAVLDAGVAGAGPDVLSVIGGEVGRCAEVRRSA